jgi:hypothetical protein
VKLIDLSQLGKNRKEIAKKKNEVIALFFYETNKYHLNENKVI